MSKNLFLGEETPLGTSWETLMLCGSGGSVLWFCRGMPRPSPASWGATTQRTLSRSSYSYSLTLYWHHPLVKTNRANLSGWAHCNPSTQEVEVGQSGVQGHPRKHSTFEASLDYLKPCLKTTTMKFKLSKMCRGKLGWAHSVLALFPDFSV